MPRRKRINPSNGEGQTKMDAARRVLERIPGAKPVQISRVVKQEFGLDLSPKVASTYKHLIQRKARGKRDGVRKPAGMSSRSGSEAAGLDDLLRAAHKLGWHRVKEVVDQVIGAPA